MKLGTAIAEIMKRRCIPPPVVASFNFSNVTWQAENFRLGARYANPKRNQGVIK